MIYDSIIKQAPFYQSEYFKTKSTEADTKAKQKNHRSNIVLNRWFFASADYLLFQK